jgi:membrane-associated phospholipid phosphatase
MSATIDATPLTRPHDGAPSIAHRLALVAINGVLFQALYGACNLAAARSGVTRSIAMAWDAGVPFLPWMLVPYMSSVPLLVLAFLVVPDRQALRALSQRCLLATAIGTLIFALWPLRMGAERPLADSGLFAFLGDSLRQLDAPYNQWPSLHVAYCVILWPALSARLSSVSSRMALAVWLLLVASSTVFTRQHYLLDIAGGAVLGALAWWAVPSRREQPWVSLHYAVAAMASVTLGLTVLPLVPCLWVAACCAAVALAYARRDVDFLHKRRGGFPVWVWLLYAPYLIGYRVTWWLVRCRERGKPPFEAFADRLWIGRRLDDREAQALPTDCAVIDLAAELTGTSALGDRPGRSFGLLDLLPPPSERMNLILDAIDAELANGRNVYLHCAMGYRRGREVAQAWAFRNPSSRHTHKMSS